MQNLLRLLLDDDKKVVFLTGAGLSVASSIPAYRSSQDAVWHKHLTDWGTVKKFKASPLKWWNNFWLKTHENTNFFDGKPNEGHHAITKMANRFSNVKVITQNIDNLHNKAGIDSEKLIEVHGRIGVYRCTSVFCPNYARPLSAEDIGLKGHPTKLNVLPACKTCCGICMPMALLFDEDYEAHSFFQGSKSLNWIREADCVVLVGTSCSVGITFDALQICCEKSNVPVFSFNIDEVSLRKQVQRSSEADTLMDKLKDMDVTHIIGRAEITLNLLWTAIENYDRGFGIQAPTTVLVEESSEGYKEIYDTTSKTSYSRSGRRIKKLFVMNEGKTGRGVDDSDEDFNDTEEPAWKKTSRYFPKRQGIVQNIIKIHTSNLPQRLANNIHSRRSGDVESVTRTYGFKKHWIDAIIENPQKFREQYDLYRERYQQYQQYLQVQHTNGNTDTSDVVNMAMQCYQQICLMQSAATIHDAVTKNPEVKDEKEIVSKKCMEELDYEFTLDTSFFVDEEYYQKQGEGVTLRIEEGFILPTIVPESPPADSQLSDIERVEQAWRNMELERAEKQREKEEAEEARKQEELKKEEEKRLRAKKLNEARLKHQEEQKKLEERRRQALLPHHQLGAEYCSSLLKAATAPSTNSINNMSFPVGWGGIVPAPQPSQTQMYGTNTEESRPTITANGFMFNTGVGPKNVNVNDIRNNNNGPKNSQQEENFQSDGFMYTFPTADPSITSTSPYPFDNTSKPPSKIILNQNSNSDNNFQSNNYSFRVSSNSSPTFSIGQSNMTPFGVMFDDSPTMEHSPLITPSINSSSGNNSVSTRRSQDNINNNNNNNNNGSNSSIYDDNDNTTNKNSNSVSDIYQNLNTNGNTNDANNMQINVPPVQNEDIGEVHGMEENTTNRVNIPYHHYYRGGGEQARDIDDSINGNNDKGTVIRHTIPSKLGPRSGFPVPFSEDICRDTEPQVSIQKHSIPPQFQHRQFD